MSTIRRCTATYAAEEYWTECPKCKGTGKLGPFEATTTVILRFTPQEPACVLDCDTASLGANNETR